MRRLRCAALVLITVLASCGPKPPAAEDSPTSPKRAPTRPASSVLSAPALKLPEGARTRVVPQTAQTSLLTGKVKLLSDQGGGVISNRSGTLLSDQGGTVISNQGGNLVANNGGSLAGQAKLLQAGPRPAPTEASLAEADVYVVDGAGRILVNERLQPLGAVSDPQGQYRIQATLPTENLVLRVPLWNQGVLLAIAPRDAAQEAETPIDTASSLGAAYVLERLVQGSTKTLDKLPAVEAVRLRESLEAARGLLAQAPVYKVEELAKLTATLRGQAKPVQTSLEAIEALLLGQANLGNGLSALAVPLSGPKAIADDGAGGFFITEGALGRIRQVSANGLLTTWADQLQGAIKVNFYSAFDLARGSDGAVYVISSHDGQGVQRIGPDGSVRRVAGATRIGRGPLTTPADQTAILPWTLWVDRENVLWIGETSQGGDLATPPRILKLGADNSLSEPAPVPARWTGGSVTGLGAAAHGSVYALFVPGNTSAKQEYEVARLAPGGSEWTPVLSGKGGVSRYGDLVVTEDGTLYGSEPDENRIWRWKPEGARETVYEATADSELKQPTDLQLLANGKLRVVSRADNRIFELTLASGEVVAVAGKKDSISAQDGVSVNSPVALALDAASNVYIAEAAGGLIKRWDGSSLQTFAGSLDGSGEDGQPATQTRLNTPISLAWRDRSLFIIDEGNGRLVEVSENRPSRTVVKGISQGPVVAGDPVATNSYDMSSCIALTRGPDKALYWASVKDNQVLRLPPNGPISLVAGLGGKGGDSGEGVAPVEARLNSPFGLAFSPDGDLYISDSGNLRIRRIRGGADSARTLENFAGLNRIQTVLRIESRDFSGGDLVASATPLMVPGPLCFDARGNLYVGELGTANLTLLAGLAKGVGELPLSELPKVPARILKIAPNGATSVLAGPGGRFFADANAGDALVLPTHLLIDAQGRLVIADVGANLVRVLPAGSF
ncbi:MAG: hypothetical protein VKP62_14190 [Candidatus Sericytochromatia bacterium]|nr:hypothetical protein [Candidatus Sericytochromatia bacterium]